MRAPIIQNRWLPPQGFLAITLFGMIFTRHRDRIDTYIYNHERIHCRQQIEWLYLPFYIIYVIEWLWHLIRLRDRKAAYRAISFEREAYSHQHDLNYLKQRRPYATFRKTPVSR